MRFRRLAAVAAGGLAVWGAPATAATDKCDAPAYAAAARANAASLRTLAWSPFRRPEIGWETYFPMIAREVGTTCPSISSGFARAVALWQNRQRLPPTGLVNPDDFDRLKGAVQARRPFVQVSAKGLCPPPPLTTDLAGTGRDEGYAGKAVLMRPRVLTAYRRMVAAAKAESPQIRADPRNLTVFSGFRSPEYDAARCGRDQNCNGITRASCSAHRTGLALDLYVGQAPGYEPDSSADANRLFQSRTAAYRWLVFNAHRFGFTNYPFEPWHWEWVGEAP
jgi:hypothetical protein